MGGRSAILEDDILHVVEHISKARRACIASSDIGIKKNGLAMETGNVMFWYTSMCFDHKFWVKRNDNMYVKKQKRINLSNFSKWFLQYYIFYTY